MVVRMVNEKPNVGMNKSADNLLCAQNPSFKIIDIPASNDKFAEIKSAIELLEIGKRLQVSNIGTNMNMFNFKRKITNIVSVHQRKFVEKKFTTQQISKTTFAVDRKK